MATFAQCNAQLQTDKTNIATALTNKEADWAANRSTASIAPAIDGIVTGSPVSDELSFVCNLRKNITDTYQPQGYQAYELFFRHTSSAVPTSYQYIPYNIDVDQCYIKYLIVKKDGSFIEATQSNGNAIIYLAATPSALHTYFASVVTQSANDYRDWLIGTGRIIQSFISDITWGGGGYAGSVKDLLTESTTYGAGKIFLTAKHIFGYPNPYTFSVPINSTSREWVFLFLKHKFWNGADVLHSINAAGSYVSMQAKQNFFYACYNAEDVAFTGIFRAMNSQASTSDLYLGSTRYINISTQNNNAGAITPVYTINNGGQIQYWDYINMKLSSVRHTITLPD